MVEVDEAVGLGLKLKDAHIWDMVLSWLILALSSSFLALETQELAWDRKQICRMAAVREKRAKTSWSQCLHWCRHWTPSAATDHSSPNKMRRAETKRRTCGMSTFHQVWILCLKMCILILFFFYRQCHLQVQSRGGWRDEEWTYEERCSDSLGLNSLQLYGHAHKQTRHPVVVCKVDGKRFTPGTKMGI